MDELMNEVYREDMLDNCFPLFPDAEIKENSCDATKDKMDKKITLIEYITEMKQQLLCEADSRHVAKLQPYIEKCFNEGLDGSVLYIKESIYHSLSSIPEETEDFLEEEEQSLSYLSLHSSVSVKSKISSSVSENSFVKHQSPKDLHLIITVSPTISKMETKLRLLAQSDDSMVDIDDFLYGDVKVNNISSITAFKNSHKSFKENEKNNEQYLEESKERNFKRFEDENKNDFVKTNRNFLKSTSEKENLIKKKSNKNDLSTHIMSCPSLNGQSDNNDAQEIQSFISLNKIDSNESDKEDMETFDMFYEKNKKLFKKRNEVNNDTIFDKGDLFETLSEANSEDIKFCKSSKMNSTDSRNENFEISDEKNENEYSVERKSSKIPLPHRTLFNKRGSKFKGQKHHTPRLVRSEIKCFDEELSEFWKINFPKGPYLFPNDPLTKPFLKPNHNPNSDKYKLHQ